jgi:ADP-heptose:LPS heptosyltransferase
MQRDGKLVVTHEDHRFILNNAALGDMITSLPAIIFAMQTVGPTVKLTVYVPPWQVDLVRHLLEPYGEITVDSLNEVPLKIEDRRAAWPDASVSMNGAIQNTHTRNRVHMVDYAFNFLVDARPENMAQRNYPTEAVLRAKELPYSYVVFPVGATSDNKLFKAAVMAPVMNWVATQGYFPVLVGTKMSHTRAQMGDRLGEQLVIRDEADKLPALLDTGYADLREKTTLLELRDILGHAAAVVGVDGGTLHLAGTTDTNIVYAMGTTLPAHRYITRQGDPHRKIRYVGPRDLECTGCQSKAALTRWDFRLCPFDDNLCMERLHHEDFIDGLKELGL